jgi:hypothetical protein
LLKIGNLNVSSSLIAWSNYYAAAIANLKREANSYAARHGGSLLTDEILGPDDKISFGCGNTAHEKPIVTAIKRIRNEKGDKWCAQCGHVKRAKKQSTPLPTPQELEVYAANTVPASVFQD